MRKKKQNYLVGGEEVHGGEEEVLDGVDVEDTDVVAVGEEDQDGGIDFISVIYPQLAILHRRKMYLLLN